jgi:hypothetical protein
LTDSGLVILENRRADDVEALIIVVTKHGRARNQPSEKQWNGAHSKPLNLLNSRLPPRKL